MSKSAPDVWNAIAAREFRGWQGLPGDADYAEFDARFPRLVDAEARGLLGSANEVAHYRMHVAEGYSQHLKAWRQDTRLVLVEATLPKLRDSLDELTSELGEPEAWLDYSWDVLEVSRGARIYPRRGIALFAGPERQLLRLSLFSSCELADYLATRHYENRLVEQPLREPY